MAITLDALLAALPAAEFDVYKASQVAEGPGTWLSMWRAAGIPAAGAIPPAFSTGGAYVPTRASVGAIGQPNPAGNRYLANLNMTASTVGSLIVYDRLWTCSGFGTVVTTAQNVVSGGTLPAGRTPIGASDVELWLEVYAAPGATAATWTITAPDGGGTSRAYTYSHPANAETVGQMMPVVPPAAAAAGVAVPTSFQASATSGTAGDIGITLMRRLAVVPFSSANIGAALDAFALGLPEVFDDACLALMVQCSTTSTGVLLGSMSLPDLTP
ncbi:MAG: hypothetical protein KBG77_06160 [Dermatophilaceae bacterium]|nr:hypothetical protein [Dermatophilaceae bacterium]